MVVPFIDLATLGYDAGWRGDDLATAVAVTVPESGRNPAAVSPPNTNGTIDTGLWQVNSVHLQPGCLLDGWTRDDLLDPKKNARAAYTVWRAQGWGAWSTYNRGLHVPSLAAAKVALDGRDRVAKLTSQVATLTAQNARLATVTVELTADRDALAARMATAKAHLDEARAVLG